MIYSRLIYIISLILIQINLYSQLPCTVTNGIGCRCADSTQTDCDLLPDLQISWESLNDNHEFTVISFNF